ncbi:glutamate synthase large subunit [Clostridium tertium]|uniref:glutamate synthase large subunit n=1 Tax=Clostridium tertium TaxID=1559 RepID=UPI0018A07BF0|nr:glutamate synthase large subunit [Clostridium tertium]MDB1948831.1 glutamate synthase large subunit [Clostridium tertium]MDU1566090.1 glutamate synthase large subunit [Clostridium sp.]
MHSDIGLYRSSFEHDACGIGAVVNIDGKKTHKAVEDALNILINLEHRGGTGADGKTGDGSGILFQIPHRFFKEEVQKLGVILPDEEEYAIGMFFLPVNEFDKINCINIFEKLCNEEYLKILTWREVPVNPAELGDFAILSMPCFKQVIIERPSHINDVKEFERRLYILRRRFEKELVTENAYISSLSCKTIVYKGLLLAGQLKNFYKDLSNAKVESSIVMVHSRYSTNTVPSWKRAHPNRYIIHNGEINTLRGNINSLLAREGNLKSKIFGENLSKVLPIINTEGSDSAILDNTLEFLIMNGRSIEEAIMMLIPEPWDKNQVISKEERAFFEYNATLMEPWDGPAAIVFTDGDVMGATLDRNGLRPARYYITKNNSLVLSSEVGALDIKNEEIVSKGRLTPGKILLVDTKNKKLLNDSEVKEMYYSRLPYSKWIENNIITLDKIKFNEENTSIEISKSERHTLMKAFDYSYDDLKNTILPMSENGEEPLSSMGVDTPLAVLSNSPQLLFNYFKQLFAQVTNPPIDAIREEVITSTTVYIGSQGNILEDSKDNCKQIKLPSPILSNEDLLKIKYLRSKDFKAKTISILYGKENREYDLEKALYNLSLEVEKACYEDYNILVLSDTGLNNKLIPIPSLLALSSVHNYLIKKGLRSKIDIIIESAEPREVHHFATLISFGASAINPYLAYESIRQLKDDNLLKEDHEISVKKYNKAILKGLVKIISKMGISTIQSYRGAQIFEAIGINSEVINKYFTNTVSRIEGISLKEIQEEVLIRHRNAFRKGNVNFEFSLDSKGRDKFRSGKEEHLYNPLTIHKLQQATRTGNYEIFKEYSSLVNNNESFFTLRNLIDFKFLSNPIPIDEVETVESIVKRFKTGAMSYGSISKEAHEALAIAMNRIGGKSNTGEGGEDSDRFTQDANGDSRKSSIKQIASGRFGVTSEYLVNANELQIKMAQGAKPGEGGQLPGNKVYPWIAKTRGATTGVGLISPPPHHDIYSIEDLAQLIYDLKQANDKADISVKLVAEAGVGTVATGVAKAGANVILISGHDGGTGASPKTSIQNAGLPWELGLAETHQTLILNGLRDRVRLETDGKLMTGRDVAIAALLGAEEFGFATAPLISLGCVMMRVCNLDSCPVGIATQNKELRNRFKGKPEYVINFMYFIAEELREYMAKLGFRTVEEMIGRFDRLTQKENVKGYKRSKVNLSSIFVQDKRFLTLNNKFNKNNKVELAKTLDRSLLIPMVEKYFNGENTLKLDIDIMNTDRTLGTLLGSEITRKYGYNTLNDDSITLSCTGSGGQSIGAFLPKGITIEVNGDCNDYLGKGLSGGKIIVRNPKDCHINPEENVIIGNVALYGATSGKAFINGVAGERFCVRNSGAIAVVEGVGAHCCEYMTGGTVVLLGECGINFAAGMSGGIAYIYNKNNNFNINFNREMVEIEKLDDSDIDKVKSLIEEHVEATDSNLGKQLLLNWSIESKKFLKVVPNEYKKIITLIDKNKAEGLNHEDALLAAFYERSAI